jgi:4,5-DOPA dioxygenase extradiol
MSAPRLPAAFIGHGSPMNALESNSYSEAWRKFGASIAKPKAILAISAHWYTQDVSVTAMEQPRTIHDFFGFPQTLFDVQYPVRGDPALAKRVKEILQPPLVRNVQLDNAWGIDHGTWSVLVHMFPEADVPVVQLSINATQPAQFHYDVGRKLGPLRDEGVLIVGSGDVVHNLRLMQRSADGPPYDWADRFNRDVVEHIKSRTHVPLIRYESFGEAARLSIPTPEHYLPLLYILGLQRDDEQVSILVDGIELGSISMLSFAVHSTAK